MAKVKSVKMHDKGSQAVLKSPGARRAVQAELDRIAREAGPGHTKRINEGPTRVRGTVTTTSMRAKRAESKDKNLTAALLKGRQ